MCRAWLLVHQRYQVEYGEGHMLGLAYHLSHGVNIYHCGESAPYVHGLMFPLYLWSIALVNHGVPSFAGPRLLSVLATLVTCLASFLWLRKRAGTTAAVAGLCLLLVHPLLLGWGSLVRVDNFGLCFSVLAVLSPNLWLSGLFCILALLSKQSFVAAPLALFLAHRKKRKGWYFAVGYGLSVVLAVVLLNKFVFGGYLPVGSKLSADSAAALYMAERFFLSVLGTLVLACLTPYRGVLTWYALTALLPVAASLKHGSYYNYYLELYWCMCMLAALTLAKPNTWKVLLFLAQLTLGTFWRYEILYSPWDHWVHEVKPMLAGREPSWVVRSRRYDALKTILDEHPGPVLAEQYGNPLVLGRPPIVCDFFAVFEDLLSTGGWDPSLLLQSLEKKEIAVILLQRVDATNDRVPELIMNSIRRNYEIVGRIGERGEFVLLPRRTPEAQK